MTLKQFMGPGVLCLKLRRNGEAFQPDENMRLQGDDRLLFGGVRRSANVLGRVRRHKGPPGPSLLPYIFHRVKCEKVAADHGRRKRPRIARFRTVLPR